MIRLILLLLLLLVFTGCGKEESPAEPPTQAEPLAVAVEQDELAIPVEAEPLPPLETGLVELKETDFGPVIELTGRSLANDDLFLTKETELLVKGGYLLQKNLPDYDSRFRGLNVFRLPDLKLVASFGRRGQGPGEFLYPSLVSTDDPDILCYMFENTLKMLYSLDRNLRLSEVPIEQHHWKGTGMMETQMHVFNPQDIVYSTTYAKSRGIHRLRLDGENMVDCQLIDLAFSARQGNYSYMTGTLAASGRKQRVVYAYKYYKRILFMDLAGEERRSVYFRVPEPAAGVSAAERFDKNNEVVHYLRKSEGDDFVYFYYSGISPVQYYNNLKSGKMNNLYIEQFDWNGNPVRKYRLDKGGYFIVDEKNCKLYMLAPDYDDPFLVYDLPPLVDKTGND